MKNKLNKILTGSVLAILLIGGLAGAQTATNTQATTQANDPVVSNSNWDGGYYNGYGMMGNRNWQNFRDNGNSNERGVWEGVLPAFAAGFVGLGIVFGTIGILLVAFWIWMLVHAASSDIKHKPLWLLVIWFMHIVGAIIYFFVVKRHYDREMKECGCEGCACDDMGKTCACGKNETCKCGEEAHKEHHHA